MVKEINFLNQLIYKEYFDSDIVTVLANDIELEGLLECSQPIKIQGYFKGEIHTSSFVWIDSNAVVEGNLYVGSLKLGGLLKGNVDAMYKIEILETGKLLGNIRSRKLKIASGVNFKGNCEMFKL